VGDQVVYDTRTSNPARISSWIGDAGSRVIGAYETVTLTFEFERNAITDAALYDLSIDFGTDNGLEELL